MVLAGRAQYECLVQAERDGVVTAWEDHVLDDTIRECRAAGWLETWELSGIQMAQTVYYPGSPWRDRLTEAGKTALAVFRADTISAS